MKQKHWLFVLGILLTVLLVYVLIREAGLSAIVTVLRKLPFSIILLTFVLYLGIYLLRLLRFQALLTKKIPFLQFFPILCMHNIANIALPARTGELSYLYLLKKFHAVKGSESLASLTISRLGDLIAILLFFLLGTFFVQDLPKPVHTALWYFSLFIIVCIAALLLAIFFKLHIKAFFESLLCFIGLGGNKKITMFQHALGDMLDFIKATKGKGLFAALLYSILQWLLMYSFTYTLMQAFGMEASIFQVFVGSSLALISSVLPMQGVLGFGTTEGIWTVVFLLLGFEKTITIASGFGVHIVSLVYAFLLGLFGLWKMRGN